MSALIAGLLVALLLAAPSASAQSSAWIKDLEAYYLTDAETGMKICRDEGPQRFFGAPCAARGFTPDVAYITAWQRVDRSRTTEQKFREGHANLARGAQSWARVSEMHSQGAVLYYTRTERNSFKHWMFAPVQVPGRGPGAIEIYFEIIAMSVYDTRTHRDLPAPDASAVSARVVNALLARLQGAGTTTAKPESPAKPEPARVGRLVVRGVGASFKQGVWLDGQSAVDFEAVLTDAQGKPLAGVPVEMAVVDRDLPRRGQLQYLGARVTDAQGRVRARYVPPPVDATELAREGPILGFQARALPPGAPPVDANENVLAHAFTAGLLRVSRVGYGGGDGAPVRLLTHKAGVVSGRVLARDPGRQGVEHPVAAAKLELWIKGNKFGEVESDAKGAFKLAWVIDRSVTRPPEVPLERPIVLDVTPPVAEMFSEAQQALRRLAEPKYGYTVAALAAELDRFPQRLAAAPAPRGPKSAQAELDRLERVAMLVVASRATHETIEWAAERYVESLAALLESLNDALSPLDTLVPVYKFVEKGSGATGRFLWDKSPVKPKIVQGVIARLRKVSTTWRTPRLVSEADRLLIWDQVVKEAIQTYLLDTASAKTGQTAAGMSGRLKEVFMRRCREQAQRGLDEAARRWAAGTVQHGDGGPLIRRRFADILEHRTEVTAKSLSMELTRANLKLSRDLFLNGTRLVTTLTSGPLGAVAVDEALEPIEKGINLLNVGIDSYRGYIWVEDYVVGLEGLGQLSRAALSGFCLGC